LLVARRRLGVICSTTVTTTTVTSVAMVKVGVEEMVWLEGMMVGGVNGRDGWWRNDDPGLAVRSARYQLPSKSIAVGVDVRREQGG